MSNLSDDVMIMWWLITSGPWYPNGEWKVHTGVQGEKHAWVALFHYKSHIGEPSNWPACLLHGALTVWNISTFIENNCLYTTFINIRDLWWTCGATKMQDSNESLRLKLQSNIFSELTSGHLCLLESWGALTYKTEFQTRRACKPPTHITHTIIWAYLVRRIINFQLTLLHVRLLRLLRHLLFFLVDKLVIAALRCKKKGLMVSPVRVAARFRFLHHNATMREGTSPSRIIHQDSEGKWIETIGYTYAEENADRIVQEYTPGIRKIRAIEGPVYLPA
jgi:hypothetical protein